jgi:hypothetical protein
MRLISVERLFFLLKLVEAQYDPIANFCKRIDHQSLYVNGKLYIDGGREIYTSFATNGTEIGPRVQGPSTGLRVLVIRLENADRRQMNTY